MTEPVTPPAPTPEEELEVRIALCDVRELWDRPVHFPDATFNAVVALMLAREAAAHARGREEALEQAETLAANPYGDEVQALGPDEPSVVGRKIAAAIRALGGGGEEQRAGEKNA